MSSLFAFNERSWALETSVFSIVACISLAFVSLRTIFFHVFGISDRTKKGSFEADVLSYEVIAGFSALYMSVFGILIWFNKLGDIDEVNGHSGEVSGYPYVSSQAVETHILIPMVSYQIVNFFLCLYINDFRSQLGLVHHISAVLIAYLSIIAPIWQYYGVYFCGVCELSSVPFAIAETMSKFERYRVKYSTVNQISRVLFVFCFWSLRVAYFLYMSKLFWKDCYHMYYDNPQSIRSMATFIFYLCSNVFMNGLQIFWGFQMFGYLEKTLEPTDNGKIKTITKELPQSAYGNYNN